METKIELNQKKKICKDKRNIHFKISDMVLAIKYNGGQK